ncbi:MAG: hypothetical protein Q9212_006161 [Teloschistes hypoglaucus]
MVRGLQRLRSYTSTLPSVGVLRRTNSTPLTDYDPVRNHCCTPRPKPQNCTQSARSTSCSKGSVARYGSNASSASHTKLERATSSDGLFRLAHPIAVSCQHRRLQAPWNSSRACQQRSPFSISAVPRASPEASAPEPLDIDQYHRVADLYIDNLVAKLEEMQEEREDVDCEYSSGVLTLAFPPIGTYVLNKQPPNKQIWLSSPKSGPKRYDYVLVPVSPSSTPETSEEMSGGDGAAQSGVGVEGQEMKGEWVYIRDGSTLTGLLEEELDVRMNIV